MTAKDVPDYLGPPRFRSDGAFRLSRPGVATGLAWTEVGGDVLYIEAVLLPGGAGHLTLTGQLGNVMQESARAALSHVRQMAPSLGIAPEMLTKHDLHIHVPAGAIPKDGPSAGVTMATAIVSAARGVPVRADVAMTGEITLSGLVLPDRRHPREGAGRAEPRHQDGHPAAGEHAGSARAPGRGPPRHDVRAGRRRSKTC